jgi:hypothetical protein
MQDEGLKVKYVQRVKRNNKTDIYFRKGDYREGPLLSPDGSQALQDEVNAILARLDRAREAAQKPKDGTVGGALKAYNRSSKFLTLAQSSQAEYQRLIDELVQDCGQVLLSEVARSWVVDMQNAWTLRGYRAANYRMQVLKNSLYPIINDERDTRIDCDPFAKLENVRRPHDKAEAHPIWTDAEVEAAIEGAIARDQPGLARAVALGRYGGFRRGTICRVPLHARIIGYNEDGDQNQRLHWLTEKRRVLCDKREDPRLTAVIEKTPNKNLRIAYNYYGEKWKERQLNQAFDRLLTSLAKEGKVRAAYDDAGNVYCPLDIHGLRHSRGVELALAGVSDAGIMAQLEQVTPAQAAKYRRQAERRDVADMAQDKVDNVRSLREARAKKKQAETDAAAKQ